MFSIILYYCYDHCPLIVDIFRNTYPCERNRLYLVSCEFSYSLFEHIRHFLNCVFEVSSTGHVFDIPNCRHYVRRLDVLAEVNIRADRRRETDDTDTCLIIADL